MRITEKWIREHATERGGWTKKQLAALGVAWPPALGWIKRLAGKEITEQQCQAFTAYGEHGCWLRSRCYTCGHRLAFDSTACPQCREEFDGRKAPKKFPERCECDRCAKARL